jgi:ergothioneine biosynthesis protein EgtB
MDIKHVLSHNPMQPAYRSRDLGQSVLQPLEWIEHPGGLVEVGHQGVGFAYDNEGPRHSQYLRPFALASRLVTNGEWLEFMADGGYERHDHWLSEGWFTVQEDGWEAPLYWSRDGADWSVYTLAGRHTVDPNEPVCHVSYFEADAFARWAGARLPTEAEWESVAASRPIEGRFLDLEAIHPAPPGEGQTQLFGDVWEWTASPYTPYPGFVPVEGAVGEYNGKFMVNQQVLRGGACVTPPGHVRPTYRNFFPASSRWAFSGLRLARDA